jgi:hypothetical protein
MAACVLRPSESRNALLAGRYREARHLAGLFERAVTPARRSGRLARTWRVHGETTVSRADRASAPPPVPTGSVSRSTTYDAGR